MCDISHGYLWTGDTTMEVVIITTMEPKMSFLQSKYGTPTLTWLLAEAATPAIYQPATGGVQRTEPATEREVNFQVKLDNDDATVQLLYEVDVPAAPLVMRLMLMETFDLAGTMFTAEDEAHIGEHVRNSQAIQALNQQMQTFGTMFEVPHPVIDPQQI